MTLSPVLQAQELPLDDPALQSRFIHSLPQMLVVLGSLLGVCFLAFLWVVFVRKPKARRRRRRQHHREIPIVREPENHKKRRRRDRRPRNPTLAETRGLPPVRDGEAFPPSD